MYDIQNPAVFPNAPLWFNEGLAEYYGTFLSDGEVVEVGKPVDRHLRWLSRQGELDLGALLEMDQASKAYHAPGQVGGFYATSWALMHFLLSGSTERLLQTADFFLHLEAGEDADEAFELAFDMRLSSLEEELGKYLAAGDLPTARIPVEKIREKRWLEVYESPPEEILYHLGDLVLHMGRSREAERHFHLALDHLPEHGPSHGGLALVRDTQNRFDEARLLYQDAARLRSAEPVNYLAWGRHLLRSARSAPAAEAAEAAEAARKALRWAHDLYPGYGEAHVLSGLSHQFPGGDPEKGVSHLELARSLLPRRVELTVDEVRLLAMAGFDSQAEALIENVLVPRGDFELEDKARSTLERQSLLRRAQEAVDAEEYEEGLELFDLAISATRDPTLRQQMEEQYRNLRDQLEGP